MTVSWQKVRVPLMERLALADMAQRRGESEEDALARIIREAVKRECIGNPAASVVGQQAQPQEVCHA